MLPVGPPGAESFSLAGLGSGHSSVSSRCTRSPVASQTAESQSVMALASDVNGRPLTRRKSLEIREPPGVNKNTNWLDSTGAWAFYAGLIYLLWLALSLVIDGGRAWTWVLAIHGFISFYLLHWVKVRAAQTVKLLHTPGLPARRHVRVTDL